MSERDDPSAWSDEELQRRLARTRPIVPLDREELESARQLIGLLPRLRDMADDYIYRRRVAEEARATAQAKATRREALGKWIPWFTAIAGLIFTALTFFRGSGH